MFGPAWPETHTTSSIVQLFPQTILLAVVGQPSAEPKFQSRIEVVARTKPSTQARACPAGPHPGSRSFAADTVTRGSEMARAALMSWAQRAPPAKPLCKVMPPELLVPIATSHGPEPHLPSPELHAAATLAMSS
ncbi:MAG: hypothetical protein EBV24_07480 [Actinobacteria bacterium]|nr:hypothetical protein [Actinomycetota bacterium]